MSDVAIARTQWYEDLAEGRVDPGWPTGFGGLDRLLAGGLRPGRLYIVAARPGIGKSSLSQWIAIEQARAGRPTLFLSQEMAVEELADRAVSALGCIDYEALQTGKMTHSDWASATEALDLLGTLPLQVDDQASLTLADIQGKARLVPGLRVLVVDYLQLCSAGSGGKRDANRNSEIEQISRGLKSLAMDLGIAVIALSQLNRNVESRADRRPVLADLRDSGAIEQDADAIIFLHVHFQAPEGGGSSVIIAAHVAKQRNGRLGYVGLNFDGGRQRWTQSTVDVSAPPGAAKGAAAKGFA
jgi:replicative DNA helicase